MTIKELKEQLDLYPEDSEVRMVGVELVDDGEDYIDEMEVDQCFIKVDMLDGIVYLRGSEVYRK